VEKAPAYRWREETFHHSSEVEVGGSNPPQGFSSSFYNESSNYQAELPMPLEYCNILQYCRIPQRLKDSPSPITKVTLGQQTLSAFYAI
jgi:hypothetical protein